MSIAEWRNKARKKDATKKAMLDKLMLEEMDKLTENGRDFCDITKETFLFNLVWLNQNVSFIPYQLQGNLGAKKDI